MHKRKAFRLILALTVSLFTASSVKVSAQTTPKGKKVNTVEKRDSHETYANKKGVANQQRKHVYRNGPTNVPPGHAKKVSGEKSARNYAPGHQKKHTSKRYHKKRKKHYLRK